jgi:hypothetical protein
MKVCIIIHFFCIIIHLWTVPIKGL